MGSLPLRWKIPLYLSALLAVLMVAVLVYVDAQASAYVNQRLAAGLETSRRRVNTIQEQRFERLHETASLVASFPGLKALLNTDAATVLDFLQEYQKENQRSELLIALDPEGRVVARTDGDGVSPIANVAQFWTQRALIDGESHGVLTTADGVYFASAVAAESNGICFGFIIAGLPVDREFAQSLHEGESEIVLLGDRVLGATLLAKSIPWKTSDEWTAAAGAGPGLRETEVNGERFLGTETAFAGNGASSVLAVILQSRDRAMEPYRRIQVGLLALGVLTVLAGIAGSAIVARAITLPIAKLVEGTKEVAAGNLDHRIAVSAGGEIGELAASFNAMVAERKRIEQQVSQAQRMEAVGRLAGGVAHDFNNLLTVIRGRSELLIARMSRNHPLRNEIEVVHDTAERASALTRQLLAFSRKQVLQPRVLSLNALVSDIEAMLQRLIGEDVEMVTVFGKNLGNIVADPTQIEQVVMNLVLNARDAMPNGGRLVIETGNAEIDQAQAGAHLEAAPGGYVVLTVTDTGIGMTDEVRAHMFEPFFTTKEHGKGTGLGLSTVYGIVKQSGGHIEVLSEPNRGAAFKVFLPLVWEEAADSGSGKQPLDYALGSETVLLVEDEKVLRDLVAEILQMSGYEVLAAQDGVEGMAISAGRREPIDLLLTDVLMPQMSGPELAGLIRANRPETRVLFMSGYSEQIRGLLDDNAAFIQKPFTLGALTAKVREVLDSPLPVREG